MDTVYSLSLLVALVAGGLGAALSVVLMRKARIGHHRNRRMLPLVLISGIIALLSGAASVAVHSYFGHGQDSAEPMEFTQFIMHHKAYCLVFALCLLAFLGYFLLSRRAGENETAS